MTFLPPGRAGYIECLRCGCPAALGHPPRIDPPWRCPSCGEGFVKARLVHEVPRDVVA